MTVYIHFSVAGFSNCYVVGTEDGRALLVDPGVIDVALINTIEEHRYRVESVLITHAHDSHTKGVRTLEKIYDARIHSRSPEISGFRCEMVEDGTAFESIGREIIPILVSGHSSDSVVYRIGNFLFTGDALGAGRIGSAPNAFGRTILVDTIKKRICSLPGDYFVFPGHGAPTTLEVERTFNPLLV